MYGIGTSCSGAKSIVVSWARNRRQPPPHLLGALSIPSRPVRLYSEKSPKGGEHESSAGTRRHTQRRVRSGVRRKAQTLGRQRPPLRGLGDLPPQGLSRRSESAVCLAFQRLDRPTDAALERRRQDV